jgi:hypothetical protein
MAKKRRTTRKKSVRTLSAPRTRRKKTMRSRRKKGMSELFSATTAMNAGRSIGAGALGGALAGGLSKLLATQPAYTRIGIGAVASFITYAVGGFPNMASGMAGAFTAIETQPLITKFMSDDNDYFDYASPNALNEMPIYLNEDGEAIYLNEDGEPTLAEDIYLNEGIYPNYSTEY